MRATEETRFDAQLLRERMDAIGIRDHYVRQAVMDHVLEHAKMALESPLTMREGWVYIDTALTEIEVAPLGSDSSPWPAEKKITVRLYARQWMDQPSRFYREDVLYA